MQSSSGMSPERYERVMALFHAAGERAGENRAAFLAGACAGDDALRREVEELLAAAEKTQGLLDEGLAELESTVTSAQFGPYRMEEKIGEGGMGMVFRAHDTKLNRPVAIKFLAGDVASAEARRRFQREAQMASSLNHPHILTVYDAGEWEGRQYLVTEYLSGGTLKSWVKAEPRTWRQVVELLVGVADGLAAAHAAGILHRDIKPGNILMHASGYAKLADFGLAKLAQAAAPAAKRKMAEGPTRPGAVIGTIPYMSPEQAAGKELDARSDVFSFGTVLYEAVAGRRPFAGATDLETLQEILHGTARPLGEETPAGLRGVIEKALEKDPADRYQSMREMVVDLRRLVRQSVEAPAPVVVRRTPRRWIWAALLPVIPIAGFLAWQARRTPKTVEPLRAVPLSTQPGVHRYPTFSPDGNYVAYTWTGPKQDNPDIYVQMIGAGSPLRLTTDPGNDFSPAWSPDGRSIAFLRRQWEAGKSELRLIPPLGGPERKVGDLRVRSQNFLPPPYITWCPDSKCLVVVEAERESELDSLFLISLETGVKNRLTNPQPPAEGDTNPALSPDGSWLVFRRQLGGLYNAELFSLPLGPAMTATGEARRLTPASLNGGYPTWMPDSKEILFTAQGSLWRLSLTGDSTPHRLPFVGEDSMMPVVSRPQSGRPSRLVYVRSFTDSNVWRLETSAPGATASSPPAVFISSTRQDSSAEFSPDGRSVAFASQRSGEWEIWRADSDGSNAMQLTSMGSVLGLPRWSPDGERIIFYSNLEGQLDVFQIPAMGGKPRNLTSHSANDLWASFSRDGQWIYFNSNRGSSEREIWRMPASGGDAFRLTHDPGVRPRESPDGAYLYYVQTMQMPSPLWRLPVAGGVPVKVLEGVVQGNFLVRERGIFYIDRSSGEGAIYTVDRPSGETRLQYFDFATGRSRTVARNLGYVGVGLTVSPDGRTILYTRMDVSVDDLMLVENFR
jgi:serine/threonine protein kinase